jgi:hypothetical protein
MHVLPFGKALADTLFFRKRIRHVDSIVQHWKQFRKDSELTFAALTGRASAQTAIQKLRSFSRSLVAPAESAQ